jgi:hypothetical protein
MNKIDYRSGEAQLMQLVREKGKRVPKILADGKIARDAKGKIVMVREKGMPRGVLVAGLINGIIRIGWSYTHTRSDKFDKAEGIRRAADRMKNVRPPEQIPHKVMKEITNSFIPRVEKYFNQSVY